MASIFLAPRQTVFLHNVKRVFSSDELRQRREKVFKNSFFFVSFILVEFEMKCDSHSLSYIFSIANVIFLRSQEKCRRRRKK
jgi:hypothetical protein